jgi:hypothetical protein
MSIKDGDQDDQSDWLLNKLTELTGGMVEAFVVIVGYTDLDGEKKIYGNTLKDQRSHNTLGLLAYGDAIERHRCVMAHFEEDDD